jgi:hypothetical protein
MADIPHLMIQTQGTPAWLAATMKNGGPSFARRHR